MIGRSLHQDVGPVVKDPKALFGADTQLQLGVRMPFRTAPQYLHVSNRLSEHNIRNMPVAIVVAQLAGQTHPPNLRKLTSRPIYLRPGNQSLGST